MSIPALLFWSLSLFFLSPTPLPYRQWRHIIGLTEPLRQSHCVCMCVSQRTWQSEARHKSSYLDSRRGRKPCNQKVKMTTLQAQTHSKANLWTWVPVCQHTSINCKHFFLQRNSSLFRGSNQSGPRPVDSPFNSQFLSIAQAALWWHHGSAGWRFGDRNDFRRQKCHWSS